VHGGPLDEASGYGNVWTFRRWAIGPWIAYARSLAGAHSGSKSCDSSFGPTLLVVLAHSWEGVERSTDLPAASPPRAIRAKGATARGDSACGLEIRSGPELPTRLDRALQRPSLQNPGSWFQWHHWLEASMAWASPNAFGTILGSPHWRWNLKPALDRGGPAQTGRTFSGLTLQSRCSSRQRVEPTPWPQRQLAFPARGYRDSTGDTTAGPALAAPALYWGFDQIKRPGGRCALFPPL